MKCPECRRAEVTAAQVKGELSFVSGPSQLLLDYVYEAQRQKREHRGSFYTPAMDRAMVRSLWNPSGSAATAYLQAEAGLCLHCNWMNIAPATIQLWSDGAKTRPTAKCLTTEDAANTCPECEDATSKGWVIGTLAFSLRAERMPALKRRLLEWWWGGMEVKAAARHCAACGWIGIVPATLVEPGVPPRTQWDGWGSRV